MKYGVSFTVDSEKEREVIRSKFERNQDILTNKEHFIKVLDYYNYHRNEVESKVESMNRVIPLIHLIFLGETREMVQDIINENYPKEVTFEGEVITIKNRWIHSIHNYIKEHKMVDDELNIYVHLKTKTIFLGMFKEEGEKAMSKIPAKSRTTLSINCYNEGTRDSIKEFLDILREEDKSSKYADTILVMKNIAEVIGIENLRNPHKLDIIMENIKTFKESMETVCSTPIIKSRRLISVEEHIHHDYINRLIDNISVTDGITTMMCYSLTNDPGRCGGVNFLIPDGYKYSRDNFFHNYDRKPLNEMLAGKELKLVDGDIEEGKIVSNICGDKLLAGIKDGLYKKLTANTQLCKLIFLGLIKNYGVNVIVHKKEEYGFFKRLIGYRNSTEHEIAVTFDFY